MGWGYSYDQAGRLTQAVLAPAAGRPQASFGYSFNPTGGCGVDPQAGMNGSRTGSSVQIGSGTPALTSYCYDQASRLTSTTGANPIDPATVSYDLHGNATRIGEVRARMPDTFPDHHIMHIAPNAHEHINTKGVITIDVSPHRDRLRGGKPPAAGIRSVI